MRTPYFLLLGVCTTIAVLKASPSLAGTLSGPPQMPLHPSGEPSRQQPYGFWESPISADWIVSQGNPVEDVFSDKVTGKVYYTERQAGEGGKNVIKDYLTKEPMFEGPYDARTRVHEYGGGQSVAYNGSIYFSNLPDDGIYEVKPGVSMVPRAVRSYIPGWRYADFDVHPTQPILATVVEIHGKTIENMLTLIDISSGQAKTLDLVNVGNVQAPARPDFVDTPRFSPDGKHIVVRVWFHPYMSWEASELWLADVEVAEKSSVGPMSIRNPRRIAGNRDKTAVGDPRWVNSSALVFTSDAEGYFNPWIYNLNEDQEKRLVASPIEEDFSEATWWFDRSNSAILDDTHVVYAAIRDARSLLYVFDVTDGSHKVYHTQFAYITKVRSVSPGKIVFLASEDTRPMSIVTATLDVNDLNQSDWSFQASVEHESPIPAGYISRPAPYVFKDAITGDPVHATYYPPTNPKYDCGLSGELPPVVVNVHGGPTHFTAQGLNWEAQLFTSHGFAWIDINYGGSMNYGRTYRERLLGQWGVVDVRDSITAVRELGALGLVDPARAAIRGGSAGGFTTFAALATAPSAFAAGTSMYGVSDLRTLQAVLHKFESYYLLKYVGGTPESDPELWWERSPVSHASDIRAPLLILQGDEDTVVPVDQATGMLETVKKNGGKAELHIFEGEGHGWRQAKTIRKALERELEWYQGVFNGTI